MKRKEFYLQVDLGQPTTFSRIALREAHIGGVDYAGRIYQFALQIKTNSNDNWQDLYRTPEGVSQDTIGSGDFRVFDFSPVNARYVRLAIYKKTEAKESNGREKVAAISEFQIYDYVPVTGITLNKSAVTIRKNASETLTAAIAPLGADQDVAWSSTDLTGSVTVDSTGRVTGISQGTAIVRATSVSDPDFFAECEVTVTASAEKDMTEFSFQSQPGVTSAVYGSIDQDNGSILVLLPSGTNVSNLIASYRTIGERVYVGDTLQTSGVTPNDFRSTVTYTVYAEDHSKKNYVVDVQFRDSGSKELTEFRFHSLNPAAVGLIDGTDIHVVVPSGTNLTSLSPTFQYTGNRVTVGGVNQISGVTINDFSQTVTYTVYADDGTSQDYHVHVYEKLSATPYNLALGKTSSGARGGFAAPQGTRASSALVDGKVETTLRRLSNDIQPYYFQVDLGSSMSVNQITLKEAMRSGLYRTASFLLFSSDDRMNWKKLYEGNAIGSKLDIAFPATSARYIRLVITAEDNLDIATMGEIEAYLNVQPVTGVRAATETVSLLNGARLDLAATVEPVSADQRLMWSSMNSAIAAVDRRGQVTGISPGTVQIKAASVDDPTKFALFHVTVQAEVSSDKELTAFSIGNAAGAINGTDIRVDIPEDTDTSGLIASFHTTGKTVSINGVPQISGITPNDFTSPVVYTVTAADLTEKSYTVTVNKVSSNKDLIQFSLIAPSVEGTIRSFLTARTIDPLDSGYYSITDHMDNSVALVVPDETDVRSLTADFETNGGKVYVNGVEQISGVSVNDFSSPVIYRVVAQDGTYKDYIVTVYKNPAEAVVTPYNEATGKSMKYVAYSSQVLNPGDNLTAWYRYSNVNGARYWIAPKTFISDNVMVNGNYANINSDPTIQTAADLDQRKADLRQKMRANPEDSTYLNWPAIKSLMARNIDLANSQSVDDAMRRLLENNIDPIVEMHFTDVAYATESEKWQKSWQTWQMIYATAFYLSNRYGIYLFEGPNEPEQGIKEIANAATPQEREEGVQKLQLLLKIYSDAIRSAVSDANAINQTDLTPIFAAPTTSTANNDITKATLRGNRTDYRGNTVDFNIVDYFVKHLYTYRVDTFENDFEMLKQMMREHTPDGQLLPILYTEFNYGSYANMKDSNLTFDDPDVVQAEASTWQSSMENGMYGMYQFKYAEKYNGQNRNFMHYQFDRPRDPAKNIALNKPVTTAGSDSANIEKVVDGNAADESAWISGSGTSHSFVIDLQSSLPIRFFAIDIGDAYYSTAQKAYTNIFGNFKLEYSEDQSSWTEIPESVVASNSVNTRSGNLESPITARYVRFTATTSNAQSVKVRDIFLSSDYGYFDIGGPLKSAEVTRLFAEGFKDQRDLYRTTASVAYDPDYKASTSYDPGAGRYYIWIPQTSDRVDYRTTIDLSNLNVPAGTLVNIREVSAARFGEVVYHAKLDETKTVTFIQPKQSVWLVTVQKINAPDDVRITPSDDAHVTIGSNKEINYGSQATMTVRQSTTVKDHNGAAYFKFPLRGHKPEELKSVLLSVYGKLDETSSADSLNVYVYGLDDNRWDEQTITAANAPKLNRDAGYVDASGVDATPVGVMTFTKSGGYSTLNITDYARKQSGNKLSFIMVKEKRNILEDNDADLVLVSSKEGDPAEKPYLEIWQETKGNKKQK